MDAARSAFVDAWSTSMWLSAGLALAAALFALVWTPSRGREHSERDARLDLDLDAGLEVLVPQGAEA